MTPNKTALLTRINSLGKEIDELVDLVISLEETQPVQVIPTSQPEPDEWLTPKQVCKRLNIAYTTFFEWLRQGKLPQGVEFSAKAKRWRMSDIRAWQDERVKVIVSPPVKKRQGSPSKVRRKEEFYA